MSSTLEEWSSSFHSTRSHNLPFGIHTRQEWFRAEHGSRCTLVALEIEHDSSPLELRIPCFNRQDFADMDKFMAHYAFELIEKLSVGFPDIQRCCTESIACAFMERIVMCAATAHRCPQSTTPGSCPNATMGLDALLELIPPQDDDSTDRAIRDSFEQANVAKPKPATADSVQGLLAAKNADERRKGDEYESGWSASDHQCVICTEKIQTRRSSLAMECSHVFHEECLVRWLEIAHVCPLCRYEMPCDV